MKTRSHRKKSKKLWIIIPLATILVLGIGLIAYSFSVYNHAKKTVNEKMHEPVESIDIRATKKKVAATDSLNILLLGIDSQKGTKGRSDALMILSVDPKEEKMQLISIPRDTRTEIIGKGVDDKINHAYAFGGTDMAVATVENFLDIELDYYVSVNMEGFKQLVDQLGSITVYNDLEWSDSKYDFGFGPIEMDGDKTMGFVRMRKQDAAGDFGRTKRQRQVVQGIINQGASIASVPKINSMIDILGNNMATNLDFDDMKKLLAGYRHVTNNFEDYQVKGEGTSIDRIYYLVVNEEERKKVREMIVGENS